MDKYIKVELLPSREDIEAKSLERGADFEHRAEAYMRGAIWIKDAAEDVIQKKDKEIESLKDDVEILEDQLISLRAQLSKCQ